VKYLGLVNSVCLIRRKRRNCETGKKVRLFEGKIIRPNFFIGYNFSLLRKLFKALTILRVEFGHLYSG
jgi:hypothetical protein